METRGCVWGAVLVPSFHQSARGPAVFGIDTWLQSSSRRRCHDAWFGRNPSLGLRQRPALAYICLVGQPVKIRALHAISGRLSLHWISGEGTRGVRRISSILTPPFQLPEKILQFIQEHHKGRGKKKNDPLVAHLRRELMHESLKLLFHDPDFREAYTHGRVIVGADGVARRHFPRIFTYSADYPEK